MNGTKGQTDGCENRYIDREKGRKRNDKKTEVKGDTEREECMETGNRVSTIM